MSRSGFPGRLISFMAKPVMLRYRNPGFLQTKTVFYKIKFYKSDNNIRFNAFCVCLKAACLFAHKTTN